jgi:CBS domain containing-hemolysin-like protein
MDYQLIYLIAITLGFSAFFSGIEMAFISSDRLQLQLQVQKKDLIGRCIAAFILKPSKFISTTLVGNTFALVLYGYFMAKVLGPWIAVHLDQLYPALNNDGVVMITQTLLSTLIVLATAEFLPKSIFMINPNRMLSIFAIPMWLLQLLMTPVIWLIIMLSKFIITKILNLDYVEDKPVYSITDLNNFIKQNITKKVDEDKMEVDAKIFHNALEFKKVKVRECMVPRTEISAIDQDEGIEALRLEFIESGHTKIIVYKESIDDIVGYCHSIEMFKKPQNVEDIITPISIVPETMLASDLMVQFTKEHKSLALVVDEYGGTSGIVSIEDIIEEIFGEIQDEHDDEDYTEEQVDESTFILSARHEVDYLNDKFNWNLPIGDYETLGGLLLHIAGDLPEKGQKVDLKGYSFTIDTMQDIRIDTVKLVLNPGNDSAEN